MTQFVSHIPVDIAASRGHRLHHSPDYRDHFPPPHHHHSPHHPKKTDGNASFLRAARAGNVEKIIEHLKGNIDINTSNANGLNALHLASKEGNVNVVTELLKRGANVNAATKKGNTALHIASLAGQEEVVKVLVQAGANVNAQSQNGFTPLYMAAQENHDSVVSFLLANGANQSLATEDGFTPLAVALQQGHDKVVAVLLENDTKGRVRLPALHIAAKKDDCKAATLLLQSDHNPDVTSKSGFTPLHIAAHYGNENIAKILLNKGADVNYAAKHQITPLHVASKWGKMNMVVLLLENGANIEAATRDGLTPLHCAARSGHDQVVDLLLEKGAPFLAKTKNGLAPLHMASQGDHVDSARILLYHKAPVDDVTVDYLTALHVAAHCGHVKVAKLLLDRKADPNARALNGFTPLHIACKKNRIKVVELLLKHGASIEATTESGLTPLHVASFMGCMNIVIYLIQNGANPDVPTVRGETPLHLAARANQTDIIRILLRNGASVDARAREEQTPLHIAARLGNVDIVSLLLQHGAAVDATTKDMYTALHIAAKEDQEEVAACLLDHGASLTSTTKKGFTPLHLAAKYGNIKVARLLIQKDAPVDAQGKNGVTPLHVASHYDHVNVALLLLDKGASPHATAKNGYTPLHIAAKKNQMDIASTLLEYGAKTNSESKAGFTPLHLASQEGHADMASLLIENKADVNHKANNGLTPLHLCAQDDRVNIAHILVAHKAEIDPQTKAGYTPLHVASHFGQVNMVRFLLQNHADVKITTSHGYTPLHQAAQQGHTLVVNLLLENQASPNVTTTQGQTPLSIAQRLGYISVVETLKVVTETTITTTTTTVTEEKYKVVAPETMQETFMTDSEDEGGADFDEAAIFGKPTHATHVYLPYLEGQNFQMSEEAMLGDQSYGYLTADEMKSLGDDSLPIDVTKDEKHHDIMHSVKQFGAPMVEEDKLSPQHVTPVETGFSEKFSPDNIDLGRAPVHAGRFSWTDDFYYSSLPKGMLRSRFLVSFMVDARGGAMRGCRHSGVRIIIPPRKASMPMRITCRYLRKEKLIHPPPLMEGEACASRILEMGPVGARFLGPVIIEVPHFASTRGKEREITILRSDTGESWREHVLEASEEAVQEVLNESFEGEELSALEDLNTNRITRILTTDFPQYFAIITRIRQEVHGVGPEGGMVSSTVVPQVQAIFPEGALTKKIRVGLQAQPIAPELVAKLLGNRVAVSPIVTVEPRRRKFHKPITLTIPVPQAATKGMINQYSGDAPTLRLLCSITGSTKSGGSSKAQWEDVTGSTPLTFVNDCVSFTTTVSARFWLMDCRQVNEVTRFATELYQEAVYVPFMSKFVIFAKRHDPYEAQLRVFCMTDDKEDKTLECQEHFTEIAKSRDVEVLEGKLQYLEFAGNIAPVTKSGEQLKFPFQAFHENRLPFIVRVKDPHIEPMGRIAFMREPKAARGEPPQVPICNLNVALPEITLADSSDVIELVTLEKRYDFIQEAGLSKPELIHRADLRLSDIAQGLDKDWVLLAQQLDVSENDIAQIKADTTCDQSEQALMMLRLWLQKSGSKATGNELEKGLRKINREDIIKNCMFNVELVTDDVEKAVAKVHLDQSGFDVFKEELGSSRDASMRRGASLDISYDEQDIMKEAESAAETSSETGSLFERDQISQALTDDKELVSQMDDPLKCSSASYDDVADLFPKCKKSSVQQSEKTFDNHLNGRKEVSAPFDISESEGNAVRNKVETNSVVLETQNYAKQHEFWPSVPVTTSNGAFIHPADSNNFENNKEISMQKGILANDEEILNIKNLSLSENGNKSPLNDKNAENYKSNDACDFGYCSMDKVTCVSPTYISEDAVPPASKNHSESTSTGIPLDRARTELTSEQQLLEKENFFQKQPPVGDPAKNVSLEREASTQNITGADVCQSAVESTKTLTVGNVCAAVGDFAMDVDPNMTGTTLHSENRSSENSDSKDAKIRRASKTPPPSPVDETAGGNFKLSEKKVHGETKTFLDCKNNDNVDRVKEILLIQSTFETKFKEDLKGPVEVEQKLADISGRQEIQARLTESETWPSLELDTSQVSISSLPEDEKSEPTTATVSDAVVLAGDTDENVESTDDKETPHATQVIQTTTVMTVCSPDLQPVDEAAGLLTESAGSPHSPELSFAEKRDFFQKLSLSSSSNATPTHTLKASADEKIETLTADEVFAPDSPEEQLSFKECLKFFEKSAEDNAPKPEIKDIKKEVWTVVGDGTEDQRLDSMSDISDIEREREMEVVEIVEKRRSTVSIDEQVSLPLHENKEVSETIFDSTKDAKVEVVVKTFVPGSEMLEICSVENIPQPGEETLLKETIIETRVLNEVKKVTEIPVEESGSKPIPDSAEGMSETVAAMPSTSDDGTLPSNEEFINKTFKTFTETSFEVSRATIGAFKKDVIEKADNKWQRESPDNISIVKDKMEPSLGKSEIFICTEETLDNVKKILSAADAESNVVVHENEPSTSAAVDQCEVSIEKVIYVQKAESEFAESESKQIKDIVDSITTTTRDFSEIKPKVIELSEEEIRAVEKSIAESSVDIKSKVVQLTEEEIRAVEESIEKDSGDFSGVKSEIIELSEKKLQAVEDSVEKTSEEFAKMKSKVTHRTEKEIRDSQESDAKASDDVIDVKFKVMDDSDEPLRDVVEDADKFEETALKLSEESEKEIKTVEKSVGKLSTDFTELKTQFIEESLRHSADVKDSVERTSDYSEIKSEIIERFEKHVKDIEDITAAEEFTEIKSEFLEQSETYDKDVNESIEKSSSTFAEIKSKIDEKSEKHVKESVEKPISDFSEIKSKIVKKTEGLADDDEESLGKRSYKFVEVKSKMEEQSEKYVKTAEESAEKLTSDFTEIKSKFVEQPENTIEDVEESIEKIEIDFPEIKSKISKLSKEHMNVEESIKKTSNDFSEIESKIVDQSENLIEKVGKSVEEMSVDCSELISRLTERSEKHMELFEKVSREATDLKTESTEKSEKKIEIVTEPVEKMTNDFTKVKSELIKESVEKIERLEVTHEEKSDFSEIKSKLIDKSDEAIKDAEQIKFHDKDIKADSVIEISPESSVISEKIEQGEENFESTFQKATKSLKTDKKESNIFEKVTEKESAVEVPSEIGDQMIPCEVSTSEVSVKEIFSEQTEVSIGADRSKSSISRPGQIEFQLATTLDDRNAEQEHEKDIEILKAKIQKEREMGLQFDENIAQSVGSTEEKSDSCFSSLKDQSVEIEFLPVLEVSEDIMKVSVDRTGHEALGTPCSFHKEMDLEDKNLESEGNLEDVEREKIISEFRMEKESPSAAGPSSVEKAEYEEVEKKEEATLEEMIYKKSRLCEKSSKEMVQSVEVTQFTEHSTEIYNVSSEKLIEKFSSKKIHIESSADGKDKAPHKLDKFLDSVTQQVLLPSDVTPVHKRTEEWLDQSGEMMLREVEPLDSAENGLFEDRPPTLEDEAHKRSSPTAESFDDKARMEQCDTDVMMQLLDFVSRNDIELSEVRTEDEAPDIEEDVSPTAEEEICSRVSCDELKIDEKISAKEKSPECLKVIESENLLLSPQRSSFDSVTSPSRRDAPSENVETVLDLRLNGRVHPQSSLEVEVGSHDSEEYLEKEVLPLSFVEEESLAQSDIKIGKMSQAEVTEGKVTAAEDKDKATADEREAELLLEDSVVKQFQQEGAPVVDSQEVVKVASSSETPVESLHISAFREEKQPEGKTDETATEHAHPFHEKTILTEDHELIVDDNYTRSVEESSNEFIPCAFVNTAFAGADLIDKVEQGSPARARSPYEVVRGEEEESKDKAIRTTYITEMRHRPMLQNIPSEISEEDLVEREIGSPELRLDALSIPQQSDVAPIQTEQKLMPEDSLSAAESSTQKTVTSETVTYDTEAGGVTKTTMVTRIYTTTTLVHGSEREQDEGVPKSNASDSSNKLESADRSLEAAAISESEFGRIVDSREQPMMSATDRIDSTKFVEPEQVMNGPGEVEYQPEYDYSGEYSHLKWSSEPFGEASYSGNSCRDPSVSQEMKKSRYSSISDDVIDYEIGEILKSDQQFEDIIERPMTPEPPIDEYLDSGMTNASLKAKKAVKELTLSEYELKEKDDSLYDDAEPISSPALSPDDSRSGFTYGMQFEKDILDVAEEAMDIDSDPYSEEKEPMYAYGMRYEREVVLEEEDVPCYGDLYTHEEEDEDALENGDKIKPAVKPKKEPEYDMLAGRKYFSKNVEIDELSVSSLQEFEHLEAEIVSGRKSSVGSLDSLNDKPPNSKSGDHDDVSMSSLTEFERLERECLEVEKIDPAMQESITQLSEIEEGHESQASETSQEHKSDGCRDEELSIIDEYDQHLGDIDNIILNVESESKDELPFQYVLKQVPKPSDVVKCEVSEEGDKTSEVSKTTDHAAITFTSEICMQQSRDHLTKSNGKNDDIDQDSLRDEVSLKPDSLTEDPRHEFLDSLHEGKCDEDDSLQGDIPDVMRDSLLEERHLEDDSLHEMDILPDESSLSMESSFAAAISHDSSRAEDQTKGKRQDGLALSATLESGSVVSSKLDKVEIIVSELPKCDIMLSSTDSLEQSSSAAAAFHFESESAMSTSLTGALASEDNTMISSTDTLEHEGRITFRYEDIPVDDLEILVKDGRKVIVDSEGNIQTEYDVKHFLDSDDNLNDFNLSSKNFTEIKLPSTSTVHVQSALTSISYTGDTDDTKTKFQHSAADEREEQKKSESFYSDPDVEVEEIHTTDEFGNPKIIKRIKKVITTRTQYSSSSSSENVEEKLKEFLREHAAGENAGLGEEVVQEERSMDDKGNILLVRTVQQQVLSQPEVHSRTFTGPDAAALSEEYIRQFKELDPTDDVCEYEKIDDEGNVVRVTQQVVIKPEMHSVSFSGPNAREQMEEYMRRFTAASQNGDASEAQSFSTVRVSTTTEQSQEIFPSERISHDLKGAAEFIQTTIATVTPESSEQIVRTVTSTCTTASTVDDPADPRASADEHAPSS
ncbi:ankyrin-2-like isoform X4 [Argiope bruennichi]|uniref:ankyrin-2-like isoform X4 n=1 Tax=Argiope bruennichi TaxID=94029 RepID=UPI0024958FF7|nr:ankyrin-2-like isoform X4 [Argiope bruennichi]